MTAAGPCKKPEGQCSAMVTPFVANTQYGILHSNMTIILNQSRSITSLLTSSDCTNQLRVRGMTVSVPKLSKQVFRVNNHIMYGTVGKLKQLWTFENLIRTLTTINIFCFM